MNNNILLDMSDNIQQRGQDTRSHLQTGGLFVILVFAIQAMITIALSQLPTPME
jgi:hypothetical protein